MTQESVSWVERFMGSFMACRKVLLYSSLVLCKLHQALHIWSTQEEAHVVRYTFSTLVVFIQALLDISRRGDPPSSDEAHFLWARLMDHADGPDSPTSLSHSLQLEWAPLLLVLLSFHPNYLKTGCRACPAWEQKPREQEAQSLVACPVLVQKCNHLSAWVL